MRGRTGLVEYLAKPSAADRRHLGAKNSLWRRRQAPSTLCSPCHSSAGQTVYEYLLSTPRTKPGGGRQGEAQRPDLAQQRGGGDSFLDKEPPISLVCPRSCQLPEKIPAKRKVYIPDLLLAACLPGHSSCCFGNGSPLLLSLIHPLLDGMLPPPPVGQPGTPASCPHLIFPPPGHWAQRAFFPAKATSPHREHTTAAPLPHPVYPQTQSCVPLLKLTFP